MASGNLVVQENEVKCHRVHMRSTFFIFGNIMKNLYISLLIFSNIVFVASAFSGQDQSLIQTTRQNQLMNDAKDSQGADSSGKSEKSFGKWKPALDHGPRAVVTPWVNEHRRLAAKDSDAQK